MSGIDSGQAHGREAPYFLTISPALKILVNIFNLAKILYYEISSQLSVLIFRKAFPVKFPLSPPYRKVLKVSAALKGTATQQTQQLSLEASSPPNCYREATGLHLTMLTGESREAYCECVKGNHAVLGV